MSFGNSITTSIHGRRLGLQALSTAQTGGKAFDVLAGAEQVRLGTSTAESTGTNLAAYGVSVMAGTSAGSSSVYVLDPPVQGVEKKLVFASTSVTLYLKTANSETFLSTLGSSFTTLKSTQNAGASISLVGLTTAVWAVLCPVSTGSIAGATST